KQISFPDHSPFSDEVLKRLIEDAKLFDAQLITTEKDFMRIPERYHQFISFIPVKVEWANENLLNSLL
ncbi:MAG: tetraacyldisaccharide 4'-kinase, partial [Alphaproteobacteria bacterium]|nr:tetraacyldisaccharide 4'-kinase [Alphaproteobacteria bacterium]